MHMRPFLAAALVAATALAAAPAAGQAEPPACAPAGFTAEALGVVIHLQWTPTPGATEYRIYRAEGDGELRLAATVRAPANESFDTHVEAGVTYRYQATAVVGGLETPACGTVSATANTDPCAPLLSVVAQDGPSNHLTWTMVVVAEGYHVYRAKGSGEAELLIRLDANAGGYVDTRVVGGEVYQYEVRAVIGGEERPACNVAAVTTIPEFPTVLAMALAGVLGVVGYLAVRRRR